jgi:hypothetical protein
MDGLGGMTQAVKSCFASMKPCVQTPFPPKKKKKKITKA